MIGNVVTSSAEMETFIYPYVVDMLGVLQLKNVQISVKLTERQLDKIQELVDEGLYSNVSEAIRDAVRRLLREFGGE